MSFWKVIIECFEHILYYGIDEEIEVENKYPFSNYNDGAELVYECSESSCSEDDSDVYNYILPSNSYKITRRNIAFC